VAECEKASSGSKLGRRALTDQLEALEDLLESESVIAPTRRRLNQKSRTQPYFMRRSPCKFSMVAFELSKGKINHSDLIFEVYLPSYYFLFH
jgi:hypothetical protein